MMHPAQMTPGRGSGWNWRRHGWEDDDGASGEAGRRMEAMAVSPGARDDPPEPAGIIPESLADLVERPLYAHLATVRPDGTPQVNPTWFRFDGEHLWLTTTTRRQKNRNWQIQPAVALSITDPDRPSRYLEIRSRVERIIPDPGGAEFVRLAERDGLPQGPPPDAADRIAVAIRPRRTTTP
jgi:PPOX class probable F420-dependent enzyme